MAAASKELPKLFQEFSLNRKMDSRVEKRFVLLPIVGLASSPAGPVWEPSENVTCGKLSGMLSRAAPQGEIL